MGKQLSHNLRFSLPIPDGAAKNQAFEHCRRSHFPKNSLKRPDTFIARKVGNEKAQEVSQDAKAVLELGGLETEEGIKSLKEFDKKLRLSQNKCNPGTTADLTAAALALCTLSGYRP